MKLASTLLLPLLASFDIDLSHLQPFRQLWLTLKISGGQELICWRVNTCPRPQYHDVRSL
jgi:hypothetical protein